MKKIYLQKKFIIFFIHINVLYATYSCKSQRNPLDHRNEQKDPVTNKDLLDAEKYACESRGKVWVNEQRNCVSPVVACSQRPDHYFDHEKDICLSPRDLCLAEKDGSDWIDGKCLSAQEACEIKYPGAIWSGNSCVYSKEACLAQGYHWVWMDQVNKCRMKGFLEYCQDQNAPQETKDTVAAIRQLNGRQMTCTEAWEYVYYQKKIELIAKKSDDPNLATILISDLYPLADLVNIHEIIVVGHKVTDILPIAKLPNLKSLVLKENEGFEDISPLVSAKSLTHLDLSLNQIVSIKSLERTELLESLILSENKISYLQPIAKLKNLKTLKLDGNPIYTAYYLRDLKLLTSLDLSKTPLAEAVKKDFTNCPRGPEIARVLDRFCGLSQDY